MRHATRNGVIAVAVVSGAMAVAGPVYADSAADGSAAGSPGSVSGNTIQLPVHAPVQACGNTVNVVGLLNPAAGNACTDRPTEAGRSTASGGASATGEERHSPGVVSGNGVQLPLHVPVEVSGNTVDVAGVGNPVFGNDAKDTSSGRSAPPSVTTPGDVKPPAPGAPPVRVEQPARPQPHPGPRAANAAPQEQVSAALAHTGADGTLPLVAASAGLLLSGAAVYRGSRARKAQ
ncbi:chaplin family protein [Streptomyces sp. NPDC057403]|uniref:chaplin n=1 Tax=Streptomyces sp. NPDC057403 TaxID=3346119 RepID=UPI0036A410EA